MTSLKILGVTISNNLSVSEHVQQVVSRCAQTLYALRTLRSRGMDDNVLQQVFKSVILGRMTHAASSWWGYTTAADKQRLDAFVRLAVHARLYDTQQLMLRVCSSWSPTGTMPSSNEYRQTNISY